MWLMQLNVSSAGEIVTKTFSNLLFWGTIIAACLVILLGFFFQKKKLFSSNWEKILVKVIVLVGLPALIIKSFMTDLTVETFTNMIILLALGIFFYFALSVGSKVFFLKNKKSIQDTLSMCVVFPSAIYFGLPIAQALFASGKALDNVNEAQNMFNIGYWVFMCAFALYIIRRKVEGVGIDGKSLKTPADQNSKAAISNNKFCRKDFKNLILSPIILALIVGFTLWVMQLIPGIKVIHTVKEVGTGWNTLAPGDYSVTRIDALIPGAKQTLDVLAALPTPLAWLAVGAVVAQGSVKEALKNKLAWYGVALKNVLMPLITLGLIVAFAAIGHAAIDAFTIGAPALVVIVLMAASPTATTIVSYAIAYDKEARQASQVCTLTTIMAVITLPVWTIVTSIIGTTGIFTQF